MYICNDCGSEFEYPKLQRDRLGEYWGKPFYEPWGACPNCGSEEIETEDKCCMCGEDYKPNGRRYCETCKTVVNEAFQSLINDMARWSFKRDDVIEVLTDLIEEE